MKQHLVFVSVLLSLVFGNTSFSAPLKSNDNQALGVFSSSINVKDYGAKGDGVTDDTRAIQAAANASVSQYEKWPVRVRHWNHLANGILDSPHPEIIFPAGIYRISNPIVFQRYSYLRGIGNATIKQTDPTKDIFYYDAALRAAVENLHFEGGKIQLHIWTNNFNSSRVTIAHCVFSDSADYAIQCLSYKKKKLPGDAPAPSKPWPPYDVQWKNGMPQLTATDPANLEWWYNSTLTRIDHCRFENVMHAAALSGDTSVISDCEVTTNPQMEGSVFNLNGAIHLYRIKGSVHLNPNKHQYWISAPGTAEYSNISVRDCDLNTNAAQGICLFRSALRPRSTSIILENSRVKSAGCPEGALLWIAKNTEPNLISINGITETSDKPVKAINWEQTPDAAILNTIKDQPKDGPTERMFQLQLAGNSANIDTALPPAFDSLRHPPISAEALQETDVPELSWNYDDLENQALKTGKVLLAADFGVDQNPDTDDTANIQKVFDAAARQGNCLVIFPAGVFKLSKTIQIPSHIVVRAAGIAAFLQPNSGKVIFQAKDAESIAFKNCDFDGGRDGVNINSNDKQKARIAFDNCSFYDQSKNGVEALAGKGEIGETNQTELWMCGGIIANTHSVTTNAARSQIAEFWIQTDPHLNDEATINNLGGSMRVQAVLGVPILWQGKVNKAPASVHDWQFSKDTRWIDNWGKLYSLDNRFGGEGGGMCGVENRSENGTVYIGGGIARFYNIAARQCILYLEKNPRRAVLYGISSVPIVLENGLSVKNADGSDGRNESHVIVQLVPAP